MCFQVNENEFMKLIRRFYMFGLVEKAFLMGVGAASLSVKAAEDFVSKAVSDKQVTQDEGAQLLKVLVEEGKRSSDALTERIEEVLKTRGESLMPYWKHVQDLEARVASLEAELAKLKGCCSEEKK